MISEWWIGKDVKGSDRGIISGNITAFAWWDWGNPWETCQDIRPHKLDLKQEPLEYKAVLLTMTFVTYSWYRTLEQWRRSCFVEFKTTFLPWQLLSSCIISGDSRNERHIFSVNAILCFEACFLPEKFFVFCPMMGCKVYFSCLVKQLRSKSSAHSLWATPILILGCKRSVCAFLVTKFIK
jgi:hypothetical protein